MLHGLLNLGVLCWKLLNSFVVMLSFKLLFEVEKGIGLVAMYFMQKKGPYTILVFLMQQQYDLRMLMLYYGSMYTDHCGVL